MCHNVVGELKREKMKTARACHHFHNFIEKIFQKSKTEWMGFQEYKVLFIQHLQFRQSRVVRNING